MRLDGAGRLQADVQCPSGSSPNLGPRYQTELIDAVVFCLLRCCTCRAEIVSEFMAEVQQDDPTSASAQQHWQRRAMANETVSAAMRQLWGWNPFSAAADAADDLFTFSATQTWQYSLFDWNYRYSRSGNQYVLYSTTFRPICHFCGRWLD